MDPTLDEEARTCAVVARCFGLIPYSLKDLWETIKPFFLGMESSGRTLNCWRHTDYNDQYKLQYCWGPTHQEIGLPRTRQQLGGGVEWTPPATIIPTTGWILAGCVVATYVFGGADDLGL